MMMRVSISYLSCCWFSFLCVSGEARVQKVAVSGSSTVMPLAALSAEEFNLFQHDYFVTVTGGSGVGIVNVAEGRSDIAMISESFIQRSDRDMMLLLKV